jgi:putative transposase
MQLQGCMSVERMCQLAEVSRTGFYRYLQRGSETEETLALRSAIQDVVMEHRWRYGYRRVAEELRTQGWIVNHKRIARITREGNLLKVQRDWFRPADHSLRAARIYLNLANRMTVLGPNQLWAADITYIRLTREFVYLAVVVDVFSRKVIGWALGRSLKARLPICALDRTHRDANTRHVHATKTGAIDFHLRRGAARADTLSSCLQINRGSHSLP